MYFLRGLITALFLSGVVFLFMGIILLSLYLIGYLERNSAEMVLSNGAGKDKIESSLAIVNDLELKLAVLNLQTENVPFSIIIDTLLGHKTDSIHINEFYSVGDNIAEGVRVAGIADTREDFISFLSGLEGDDIFSSVESPLSSLSKGVDIDFSLDIKLKRDE